ncbi:MAG: hypothetical protein V9G04_10180 [Nocardioides sp.]
MEQHPGWGKVAVSAGIAAQFFVTIVGGALATALVFSSVALWKYLT